jgi:hypothetical protein
LIEFTGELGIVTQTNSATVCTSPLMTLRSAPPWTAVTTRRRAASPNGKLAAEQVADRGAAAIGGEDAGRR